MPVDASIALGVRPPQIDDPQSALVKYFAGQRAQTQNALAQYQLSKARQEDESASQLDSAYRASIRPDGTVDRNALYRNAPGRAIPGLMEKFQKLDETQLKNLKESLSISGGALASISNNPTRANTINAVSQLVAMGLPGADKMLASIPQNDAEIPAWVRLHASTTDHTLKALEAFQPKPERSDEGGVVQYREKNPLAGTVGAAVGAPITKTMTPEGIATRDVTMRGQNMTDARAREGLDLQREKMGQESTPAAIRAQLAQNNVTLDKITRALDGVSRAPDSFGLKNYAGDAVMQRADPAGVEARALVADIGSQKIHDRSGAAVTLSEAPRLRPFVPDVRDDPATVTKKLGLLQKEYTQMQEELSAGKSIVDATRAGNKAKGAVGPKKPTLGEVQDGYLYKGGDPAKQSSWEKVK